MLGIKKGGWQYKGIKESLRGLKQNNVETNFWWDTISGERIDISNFNFLGRIDENKEIKRTIIPAVKEAVKFLGYTVTYNDTGAKNEKGEIIRDPKGEEKFRFYKERQELPFSF